jgi:hypothetical protein
MSNQILNTKINELYNLYENNNTVLNKLIHHITYELPIILINTKKLHKNREDRRLLLQEAHDKFVTQFIQKNVYFYSTTSEIFFMYDSTHYTTIKEDTIIHAILSALNLRDSQNSEEIQYFEKQLLPWKFKIKTSIIKQIRDTSIIASIPESSTIQNTLNIFAKIFETKSESKYFLSTIGDTILKKSVNINIISSDAKNLIRMIENIGSQYFGHIPLQNAFRFKYHEHNYNECRIFLIKNKIDDITIELLHKIILDIIVIACYYSNRYNTADEYLKLLKDSEFCERVLFLKNNNQTIIIEKFIDSKIQSSTSSCISMKNMLYLWKSYLDEIQIPNVIFITTLKPLLKSQLKYDDAKDCFIDCTSINIPFVSNFVKFWDKHIKEDINEYYLEIDELCILFKQFLGKNQEVKETTITDLIKHFYPEISIDGKYIYAISCDLWNKQEDIINYLKTKIDENTHINTQILLYELYTDYTTKYCKKVKNNIIISKSYFYLFINNLAKNVNNSTTINLLQLQLT